jgi:hypothetical protein
LYTPKQFAIYFYKNIVARRYIANKTVSLLSDLAQNGRK